MSPPWTVRRVLEWTADDFQKRGLDSPRLDADLLVARALGLERIALYLDLDRPLLEPERGAIRELVERRRAREPVAYILGQREFFGRAFEVTRDVLIPRPDTETLVQAALDAMDAVAEGPVLDLCTGSGAVAVSLAAERPERAVVATDVSAPALKVAERNATRHGVEGVVFRQGDLFAALESGERFAVITANPPYIDESERPDLAPEVTEFEPGVALFAADGGMAVLQRIVQGALEHLQPGGRLLVEIGHTQVEATRAAFEQAGLREVRAIDDLAGIARVVEGARESP